MPNLRYETLLTLAKWSDLCSCWLITRAVSEAMSVSAKNLSTTRMLSSAKTDKLRKGPRKESFSNSIPVAAVIESGKKFDWRTI